ncbi:MULTISPECIES: STAS domain-containing protein [unclassified Embleya]|uniref:STAS domain-containing protein n=1 Tax=unclassified Embleya TaxID=2699296 RepID=UPI0033FBA75E
MYSCPSFTVTTVLAASSAVITVSGEIDVDAVPELEFALDRCLDQRSGVIRLDLGAVRFCDCAGLSALLRARLRAYGLGSTLLLHDVPPAVARLLTLTETDELFERRVAAA